MRARPVAEPATAPARPQHVVVRWMVVPRVVGVAAALLLAACADGGERRTVPAVGSASVAGGTDRPSSSEERPVPDGYTGRFVTGATVLQAAGAAAPALCHGVLDSLPPQCGGPAVEGWDWSRMAHESVNGVRWGTYVLTGTFDGTTFRITEPPSTPQAYRGPRSTTPPPADFSAPCPVPQGGWRPVDPATATDAAFAEAMQLAEADPDLSGAWIDQNHSGTGPPPTPDNDPRRIVLVATTTGDVETLRTRLRAIWGGALCVARGERREADLRRIQDELTARMSADPRSGLRSAAVDVVGGRVDVEVLVATQRLRRELDDSYGVGVVHVTGLLHPID